MPVKKSYRLTDEINTEVGLEYSTKFYILGGSAPRSNLLGKKKQNFILPNAAC